ncbi:hypothetical protein BGX20_008427 [Mortierella sp. AD010]|nr:hypothetical protein BGX20_008427 [Mortierella sp. AD010]
MASAIHQSRSNTAFNSRTLKSGTTAGVPTSSRYNSTSQIKASSKPSSPPRTQYCPQPYSSQSRSASSNSIVGNKRSYSVSSTNSNINTTTISRSNSISSPSTTLPPYTIPSHASIPTGTASTTKHAHSLSSTSTISYPHPSIHPPLRLLTSATCLETLTCLVSAQSPPHSPTFTAMGLPKSTSPGSGGSGSRASSILDGIQSALGGALGASSSSPPTASGTLKSSYSAAQESLADFSIPASKRSTNVSTAASSYTSNNQQSSKIETSPDDSQIDVTRSRSNYVSFPNFDDIDFVDVAMVEDREEDDDDDHPDWYGPDSPPEGQRPSVLEEKMMRPHQIDSRIGVGMPTTPSQHWLLQLENFHELHVNGVQV